MELLRVYNEHNEYINQLVDRDIVHIKGLWHREVLIIVINKKGEILLQKRSNTRKYYPNKWALCAGHVVGSEKVYSTAIRELKEEIGLKVCKDDLNFIGIYKKDDPKNRKFSYIYIVRTNTDIDEYTIQKDELSQLKYISISKLIKLTKSDDKSLAFHKDTFHISLFKYIKENII